MDLCLFRLVSLRQKVMISAFRGEPKEESWLEWAQCSSWNESKLFYLGLTQNHSLEFAKEKSLDLVHWIVLSDHCSVHLRPWKHNQLTRYSQQDSSGITPLCAMACVYIYSVCSCVCAPWTCVSSFALYSWFLIASSTPYPERWTFFSLGFYRKRNRCCGDHLYLQFVWQQPRCLILLQLHWCKYSISNQNTSKEPIKCSRIWLLC